MADLARRDELGHRADGLLDRRLRVDAVLVVEVDVVDAEAPQRVLAARLHVVGAAVDAAHGRVVGVADDAELRRQHDLVAAVGDRPADELLVGVRPVDVGGVQQRHAELEGAVDRGDRLVVVAGAVELAHAHAAEAEGGDGGAVGAELSRLHRVTVGRALRSQAVSSVPALSLRALTKRYDNGFLALDAFDVEIPDGAFFGLLGPNGAGKTTLISAVCNLIRTTSGDDRDLRRRPSRGARPHAHRAGRAGRQPRPLPRRRGDAALPRRLLRDGPRPRPAPGRGDDGRLRPAREGARARADALGRHAPAPAARPRADARAAPGDPRRADRRRRLRAAPGAVGATSAGCTARARRSCSPRTTSRRPRSCARRSR